MYAIVDIETTGGPFNKEGITEIAIYKFDGHEIVDQFISLVNPEIPIQPFVVKLTGINNSMLRTAPKFYEIAKRIVEITEDCILVAHNADFDYRVLKNEFKQLGYTFSKNTLCTVQLSKKLIPELPSYSLGKLVRSLGIPIADRHRASGDAMATLKLLKLLLSKDTEKQIVTQLVSKEIASGLHPKLLDIIAKLPSVTGIYYMYNDQGKILYIGKSKNIKKRVIQHFTNSARRSLQIQNEVYEVTYEETGSELIALLKENEEIKQNKPLYNRALRKTVFQWGLYVKTENEYTALVIEKTDYRKKELTSFSSYQEGQNLLFKLTEKYNLCQKINHLTSDKGSCFLYKIKQCNGACVQKEAPEVYNIRAKECIKSYQFENQNFIILDKGRSIDEKTAVLVENGVLKGYCFYNLNYQVTNLQVLKNILIPLHSNKDGLNIVRNFIRKNKVKIVRFTPEAEE